MGRVGIVSTTIEGDAPTATSGTTIPTLESTFGTVKAIDSQATIECQADDDFS